MTEPDHAIRQTVSDASTAAMQATAKYFEIQDPGDKKYIESLQPYSFVSGLFKQSCLERKPLSVGDTKLKGSSLNAIVSYREAQKKEAFSERNQGPGGEPSRARTSALTFFSALFTDITNSAIEEGQWTQKKATDLLESCKKADESLSRAFSGLNPLPPKQLTSIIKGIETDLDERREAGTDVFTAYTQSLNRLVVDLEALQKTTSAVKTMPISDESLLIGGQPFSQQRSSKGDFRW